MRGLVRAATVALWGIAVLAWLAVVYLAVLIWVAVGAAVWATASRAWGTWDWPWGTWDGPSDGLWGLLAVLIAAVALAGLVSALALKPE